MQNESLDRMFEETREQQLSEIEMAGMNLIQMADRMRATDSGEVHWLDREVQKLNRLVKEMRGLDPEEPQAGDTVECVVISGGYGTSITGQIRRITAGDADGPQLAIPLDMAWTLALERMEYYLAELKVAIQIRTDSKVGALNLEDLPF
jgi:hypothetical protein